MSQNTNEDKRGSFIPRVDEEVGLLGTLPRNKGRVKSTGWKEVILCRFKTVLSTILFFCY